ncbi:MAG: SDR family oxidoreductase [Thermoplasmata archaeon]|nr:SDR family oxidoreductase [Thermoplasmata archaeon]
MTTNETARVDPPVRSYSGKVALVVGASRGIGAETAMAFGRHGATVVLASRDAEALEKVAEGIRGGGGKALVVPTDLADPSAIAALGARIRAELPGLHAAFNNAGEGYAPTPLGEVPLEAFERVMRVTLTGTFLALQQEIPLLLRAGGGAIVNMSSTAGFQAFRGGGPYVAAKHAILGLTKAAAIDYAERGIRVNAVAPGPIDTHRLQPAPEAYREQARQAVPMRRLGTSGDVANVVLWLCSQAAEFVTGATVPVDGGRMAGYA